MVVAKEKLSKPSGRGRKGFQISYDRVRPLIDRGFTELKLDHGRRKVLLRKYHLTQSELEALRAKYKDKGFINPYSREGAYYGSIEALVDLGIDQFHSIDNIVKKMQQIMSKFHIAERENAWTTFMARVEQSEQTVEERVSANFSVLQRLTGLHPYGMKLAQVHACIDIRREFGVNFYCLRTNFKHSENVAPKTIVITTKSTVKDGPVQSIFDDFNKAVIDAQLKLGILVKRGRGRPRKADRGITIPQVRISKNKKSIKSKEGPRSEAIKKRDQKGRFVHVA